MILGMAKSTHSSEDRAVTIRPRAVVLDRAQDVLDERSLEMRGFFMACLAAVAADPDVLLTHIAQYWPEPKRRGRPPKTAANADRPAPPSEEDRAADDASA